jgi:hypothetical protein
MPLSSKPDSNSTASWMRQLELKPEDFEFHEKLLRHFKGMVNAYETWLKAKKHHQS